MHGDGVVERTLLWPQFDGLGGWLLVMATVLSRRYRCPECGVHCTVRHRGLRYRARYAIPVIVLFLRLVAPKPLGEAEPESVAFALVSRVELPTSNPGYGSRRWSTLWRWRRSLARYWPRLHLTESGDVLTAWLAALVPGGTWHEVVEAAIDAHAQEGHAM